MATLLGLQHIRRNERRGKTFSKVTLVSCGQSVNELKKQERIDTTGWNYLGVHGCPCLLSFLTFERRAMKSILNWPPRLSSGWAPLRRSSNSPHFIFFLHIDLCKVALVWALARMVIGRVMRISMSTGACEV